MTLKKSTANKPAPLQGAGGHGAEAPHVVPNRPGSEKGHVIQSGAKPAGKSSKGFSAPRKEASQNPMDCGYTKPSK